MLSFVADSYKSMPPSAGFVVLAEHVVHLVSEVSDIKEEVRSLKELNSRMGEILDIKEDIHDVKCMLVKVLPQRSSSTLPSNGNNNDLVSRSRSQAQTVSWIPGKVRRGKN